MPSVPDYSIVVPAFNEERFLPETLRSIEAAMRQVPYRGEVVVCDNNSTDRTAEIARAAGARVAFEPINQISRARNSGARVALGRWLIWIDADTLLPAALLAAALERLASGDAGGGSTVEMQGPSSWAVRTVVYLWTRISVRFGLAAGAFLFATREAFEAVSGFSERVYASEEIWFSRAIKRWGREQGREFAIVTGHPVRTSQRKAEWYSSFMVFGVLVLISLCPFLVRSKRFCFLWYRRP